MLFVHLYLCVMENLTLKKARMFRIIDPDLTLHHIRFKHYKVS